MSQEDYPVDFVLQSIEHIMPPPKQPKVLLFDIGGVCVLSPFQAILDYEISHGIPPGWINHSISKSSPNGSWQRLERGEISLDASFFTGFNADLRNPALWSAFYTQSMARSNLAVETIPPVPDIDGEWLFWEMMSVSRASDPWMWPALQALKRSRRYILAALSNTVIFPSSHPFAQQAATDVRSVFDVFISSAHVGIRKPDPAIYELALREVDAFAKEQHANGRGEKFGWGDGVRAEDVLFLDDIGENLKAGRRAGFRTLRVFLGKAYEAVDELESITGLELAGTHPRVSSAPKIKKSLKGKL